MFFRGEYDLTENTRNINDMLRIFSENRDEIKNLLENNSERLADELWKPYSVLSIDRQCLFRMGEKQRMNLDDVLKCTSSCDSVSNLYICPMCKNSKRIIDFSKTAPTFPFLIECGDYVGTSLTYTENPVILYLNYLSTPSSILYALQNPSIKDLAKCSAATCSVPSAESGEKFLNKYKNFKYLASDKFTNNLLINYYLNSVLSEMDIPHILKIHISFVCNDMGYNITEYTDLTLKNMQTYPELLDCSGKLSPTSKADARLPLSHIVSRSILLQLFAFLHFVKKYDFSHGNICSSSLKFKKESLSYVYDGVHIDGPLTLKITDFETSGLTIYNNNIPVLRLYNKSVVAEEELGKKTYSAIIETTVTDSSPITIYKLRHPERCVKSNILYTYMKHLGLPVFTSSFNSYAFMIVLMTDTTFYYSVISDSQLSLFWKNMWINLYEYDIITERIKTYHELNSCIEPVDVYKILSDLSLRCDMTEWAWTQIKKF